MSEIMKNFIVYVYSSLIASEKFHRRDLNLWPTDLEGNTLTTQTLSHRASTVYAFSVPDKLLTSSQYYY